MKRNEERKECRGDPRSCELFLSSSENKALKKIHFPVGLLTQLVERCTNISEVMDSNPVYNRS